MFSTRLQGCRGLPSLASQPPEMTEGESDELIPEGIPVDSVNARTAVMSKERLLEDFYELSTLLIEIKTMASSARVGVDDRQRSSALSATLIAGDSTGIGYEATTSEDILAHWIAFFSCIIKRRIWPTPTTVHINRGGHKHKERAGCYYSGMDSACRERRFFTTRNGLIGLGHSNLQHGDLVTVL